MQRLQSRMTPKQLEAWIERHGLTREQAGKALGASRRAMFAYLAGDRKISQTLALLCRARDQLKKADG